MVVGGGGFFQVIGSEARRDSPLPHDSIKWVCSSWLISFSGFCTQESGFFQNCIFDLAAQHLKDNPHSIDAGNPISIVQPWIHFHHITCNHLLRTHYPAYQSNQCFKRHPTGFWILYPRRYAGIEHVYINRKIRFFPPLSRPLCGPHLFLLP
jgi:hypothetical protein